MSDVYFTADLHLGGHEKVAQTRGFGSTKEHDDKVLDLLGSRLSKHSILWVLGDLSLKGTAAGRAVQRIGKLPGAKHLIWGNHDEGHPQYRDASGRAGRYLNVFDSVAQSASRKIAGRRVLLSHYPYDGDHTDEDRDVQWRLRDYGTPLLHGHVHSDEALTYSKAGTPQIHVGLDAWELRPVSLEMLVEVLVSVP